MKPYEKLGRENLQKHAQALYPNTHELTKIWNDEHWEQLNQRLFNVADLMRNIQQGFARWFNKNHNRRGRFWADRFKSTILYLSNGQTGRVRFQIRLGPWLSAVKSSRRA